MPFAQSLGLLRLAAWYALELSTQVEAPFSTGAPLSQALFRQLEEARVLRTPSEHDSGIHRALYEPLGWCHLTDWGERFHLQVTLQAALLELVSRQGSVGGIVELWEALSTAEIETYLAHLFRRHALEPANASFIVHAMANDWSELSLARKRYLAWHATRGGTAALLRNGMDQDAARTAMLAEMRRRSRWLTVRSANNDLSPEEYQFVPDPQWKKPVLLSVFLSNVLPPGLSYWADHPSRLVDAISRSKTSRKS
ncbi:hypothetical protein ACIPRS_08885 [Pseudoxanthomonas sp. LARHCG66]